MTVVETVTPVATLLSRMQQYVQWYVELEPFYKIMLIGSVFLAMFALVTGMGTENPVFFLLGVGWLVVGPGAVWLLSRFEGD